MRSDIRRRVEALMTDYFRDARSVTRALGRVRRAALPPTPTPIRLVGENLMCVVEGITFADFSKAVAAPAEWLSAFEAAVSRNVPVADDALAMIERVQQKQSYAPETFLPTTPINAFCIMRPDRGVGPHGRDARVRPARRHLPELNEISCV